MRGHLFWGFSNKYVISLFPGYEEDHSKWPNNVFI